GAKPAATTVDAPVAKLRQQVGAHLKAGKLTPLVFDAGDLRVLQQLSIEAHKFLTHGADGAAAAQAVDPGEDIGQACFQRGRQPAVGTTPVVETRFAIPRVPLAARAPTDTSLVEACSDLLAPVGDLGCPHHRTHSCACACSRTRTRIGAVLHAL